MKITVKETTERELEIKLPAYRKSIAHYFKVVSDKECIMITDCFNDYGISTYYSDLALSPDKKEINEQEFINAFERIMNKLKEV